MSSRIISVLGLGFGDCGKGLFTDALCRRLAAHTVVRFNGGAQAGHNVVLPDGRHHTFSQMSAATFIPNVVTVLAQPVVVHPSALLVENEHLKRVGVMDALHRLLIDGRCRINTPFHQAAGRLKELARGVDAHGTCGLGFGETVRHALALPEQALCYADLFDVKQTWAKLESIRLTLLADVSEILALIHPKRYAENEIELLRDPRIAMRWLQQVSELIATVPPSSESAIADRLQSGTILFEGAQGVLLDEWRGFHPYTTWSSTHAEAANALATSLGCTQPIEHLGVLRSYLTRHGQGPLPTYDESLNILAEPHNTAQGWQGQFRRGHFDAVLLRYALSVVGKLDGLLLSHLDAFEKAPLKWCETYHNTHRLPPCQGNNLDHQYALTQQLLVARPQYDAQFLSTPEALIAKIEDQAHLPVLLGSYGTTCETVRQFKETGLPAYSHTAL